jgi:hypothetical protein
MNEDVIGAPPQELNNQPNNSTEETYVEFSLRNLSYIGTVRDQDNFRIMIFMCLDEYAVAMREMDYIAYVMRVNDLTEQFINTFPKGEAVPTFIDMCFPFTDEEIVFDNKISYIEGDKEVKTSLKTYYVYNIVENVDIIPLTDTEE